METLQCALQITTFLLKFASNGKTFSIVNQITFLSNVFPVLIKSVIRVTTDQL